ncbi:hypothetical protein K439DRAFT_411392 [Ramaria rubella]|nr:hypothetical protein K439DRAFT_411392 [Ramaria rubella]
MTATTPPARHQPKTDTHPRRRALPRKSSPSPRAHSPHASPILLANGKPLRPSLKSSSSSPHIPTQNSPTPPPPPQRAPPPPLPIRTLHALPRRPQHTHAHTPKNVHFKEDARLASVRVFNKAGRPRSVSTDTPDETETETEGYDSNGNARVEAHGHGAVRFPFPRLPPPTSAPTLTLAPPPLTSSIPAATTAPPAAFPTPTSSSPPSPSTPPRHPHPHPHPPRRPRSPSAAHSSSSTSPTKKRVSVRFTLDDWLTTSEVGASYCGAGVLPVDWARCVSGDPAYDTFTFTISLSRPLPHAYPPHPRALPLCAL